ncbi:acyltransferase [Sphingomonas sp. H39-1-10]|uniref:acyltransferase family protein n=1 Tax=Sphingomonas pollutisoli TaxID=3030829 RepID=UPI0023B93B89|nr:acyltransferase [Sphingomonas pollutisoli]MDF0486564.1 acyltransferase [Sphingomonas pollutisoli]
MRFRALDSWRGLAALLVLLFHLSANGAFYAFPPIRHGGLSVPFFFVLSGFVITHAYGARLAGGGEARRFVVRRIGRLYPLHVVTLGALVALELVKWAMVKAGVPSGQPPFVGANGIGSLVANVLLLQAIIPLRDYSWNGPSWSISVEFYTCLVFGAVAVACRGRTIVPAVLLVATGGAALVALELYRPDWPETQFKGLASCICGFFTGHLVYRIFHSLRGARLPHATMWEVGAVGLVVGLYWFAPVDGFSSILIFALVVLVFAFDGGAVSRVLAGRPWALLGKLSYSIYLLHFVLFSALGGVVRAAQSLLHVPLYRGVGGATLIDFGPPGTMDLLALVCAAMVIGLAVLSHRWIELPGQRLFERFAQPNPTTPVRPVEAPVA